MNWSLIDNAARVLGIRYNTRKQWKHRNHVPYKWRIELMATDPRITPDMFSEHDKQKKAIAA